MFVNKNIPRISTRGRFDLLNGKPIAGRSPYTLYPARTFDAVYGSAEVTIMIHGLRNNPASAVEKFNIAKRRLVKLGYKHPLVGFSYDSNTRGAHIKKTQLRALRAGQRIAKYNGKNLARFIIDFHLKSPKTKFRLLGHSLGSEVIYSTLVHLGKLGKYDLVSAVYLFGASVPSDMVQANTAIRKTICKIVNYYNPNDEVLCEAVDNAEVRDPLGLGTFGKTIPKYVQKRARSKNHRFASYALTLGAFP